MHSLSLKSQAEKRTLCTRIAEYGCISQARAYCYTVSECNEDGVERIIEAGEITPQSASVMHVSYPN